MNIFGKKRKVIAVISPKGGTGKTTTIANLSIILSNFKKYILILDTNITNNSLGLHFGIINPKITFKDVIDNKVDILQSIYFYNEYLQIIPSTLSLDVYKISKLERMMGNLTEYYNIMLSRLLRKYDLILLDTISGINRESIAAMLAADALIIVSNPDLSTVMMTAKAINYANSIKRPIIGIVLNKIKNEDYELTKEEIEESTGVKVIGEIPEDNNVPKSIADKIPVVLFKNSSSASIGFKRLACNLTGTKYNPSILDNLNTIFKKIS